MDIDTFQEEIGGISRYQVLIILIGPWMSFASGFHTLSSVFLSAVPEHRCSVPPLDDPQLYNLTEDEIKNLTIPYNPTKMEYDSCSRYDYNLSNCGGYNDFDCITSKQDAGVIPCDKGYHYDRSVYKETTISQWNLVCDRQYLDSLTNTLFFFGFFIGSLFVGPLTDWFGRKIGMFVIGTGLFASGIGCAFVPIFELYVFVRILIGAFSITSFIVVYTYVSEISSKKWRTEAAAYTYMLTAIMHSVMPGIAYVFRDWHRLQFVCTLIILPFYVIVYFIPESPRWLISRNRFDEAKVIVGRYASSKGKVLTEETWHLIVETEIKKKEKYGKIRNFKVWDLLRRPIMRLLSLDVMFCWFTVSMVFFGLSLNGGNLAGDPYLNNALNGLVEVGGVLILFLADPLGRRPVLSTCYLLCGTVCITSMLLDQYSNGNTAMISASTGLAISGKMFGTTAFSVIYAVTAEIYPTDVRSTALSMGSMAARIGSMLTPFILQLQNTIPWFAQALFGVLSILAGFATFFYPETSSTSYMTTLDESEEFYRESITLLRWLKKVPKGEKAKTTPQENAVFMNDDEENTKMATKL